MATAALAAAPPAGSTPASAGSATPSDQASTRAYLTAVYNYAQESLANAPATRAVLEGWAGRVGAECPGVLKGAPPESPPGTPFARKVGESKREGEQLNELEFELGRAENLTAGQAERQALLAFAAATRTLRWSDAAVTRSVSAGDASLEAELAQPVPDVCADMQAWVASGYRTLPAATKELRSRAAAAAERDLASSTIGKPSYPHAEDAAERALNAQVEKLYEEKRKALGLQGIYRRLDDALGIAPAEPSPTVSHPPAGATVIDRGRTAAGGRYEVLLMSKPAASSRGGGGSECPPGYPLSIRIVTTMEGGVSGCFSRGETRPASSVNCSGGLLTIEGRTGPAVREVRLRLSNGRQITTRPAIVPARLGGPLGLYYQVVRGPKPIPVSLTELNAKGRTLRVVKLPRIRECDKQTLKYLRGGIRALVRDRVPGDPEFSIVGEAYRFLGHIYFDLDVKVGNGFAGAGGESASGGRRQGLLPWTLWYDCTPHFYAVLYGVLKQPADTAVLARTSGKLHALRRVAIPAHLHAGGVLVYTAAATAPSELVVRDRAGRTILTENLTRRAKEATEMCEGEAEGTEQSARKAAAR